MISHKQRDGFAGQRMVVLPPRLLKNAITENPLLAQLYITQMGHFPKASFHYRERRNGCPDNILFYCQQGKGWYVLGKEYFEIKANEYAILPAGTHYMRYGADEQDPWSIYWVHFSGTYIQQLNQLLSITASRGAKPVPFDEKTTENWETIYHSLELGFTIPNICNANFCLYKLIANFVFLEQHLSVPSAALSTKNAIIDAAIKDMKSQLNQMLTVDEIAARQGISASHLTHLFKSTTGRSPIDYFIQLKMQIACKLLHDSNMKIKSVALEVGYKDPYYFSRAFKNNMSLSPEQYRKAGWRAAGLS